jgi:hypothetical protein
MNDLLPRPLRTSGLVKVPFCNLRIQALGPERILERYGMRPRCQVSREQRAPKLLDVKVKCETQLRKYPPDFRFIIRSESLSAQHCDSVFDLHPEQGDQFR